MNFERISIRLHFNMTILALACVQLASGIKPAAQTTAPAGTNVSPAYTVASVKVNTRNEARSTLVESPDGLSTHRQTLFWLVQYAFGLPEQRMLLGMPSWASEVQYDIDAKVDETETAALAKLTGEQRHAMLRPVLEDRFKLKYHFETRQLPDFALVVAKGGPNTSNLKPSDASQTKPAWKYSGRYKLAAQGFQLSDLCYLVLSTEAQRLMVDQTGLTGRYDLSLNWSREDPNAQAGGAEQPYPSIFTAVQEQLGLKMVPVNISTKVLVVDSVERPSEN